VADDQAQSDAHTAWTYAINCLIGEGQPVQPRGSVLDGAPLTCGIMSLWPIASAHLAAGPSLRRRAASSHIIEILF
jgi:hypothetical protein